MNIKKLDEELKEIIERTETLNSKVKDWYLSIYSSDDVGNYIDSEVTFADVYKDLANVYDVLKCEDSIVRERVFIKLSELQRVSYDVIYRKWLKGGESA